MVFRIGPLAVVAALLSPAPAYADNPVLDWIGMMNQVTLASPLTNPLVTTRNVGLVSAAVFDAVNGIETRYRPLKVGRYTGPHASARAASIQAAYAMLLLLYPQQRPALDAQLTISLAGISSGRDADRAREIAHGRAYGQRVADAIFAARASDGFAPNPAPPFVGVVQVGFWRPTLAGTTGAGPQFATMTPWVLKRASQFRLGPPLPLTSAEYAADYNEVKMWGAAGS